MSLTACRYNNNHKMKTAKLLLHEQQCPDRFKRPLRMCPYNPNHKTAPEKFEHHKKVCESRPQIDEEVENQIREYLNNQKKNQTLTSTKISLKTITNNSINSNNENIENLSENLILKSISNNSNSTEIKKPLPTRYGPINVTKPPVGLRQNDIEKKIKKERKNKQKEMMNLIENSEFEEIIEKENIIDFSKNNIEVIDEIYENEFKQNVPKINHNDLPFDQFDKQSHNTLFTNLSEYINNSHLRKMIDNICEKADYDPNASDLFIDKKNRNFTQEKNMFNVNENDSFIVTENELNIENDD